MEIATVYYEQLYYMGNLSKKLAFHVYKNDAFGCAINSAAIKSWIDCQVGTLKMMQDRGETIFILKN